MPNAISTIKTPDQCRPREDDRDKWQLEMTDKKVKDFRLAMSVLQRALVAERRKTKCFRDQIERFKIDVQENGIEAQLEKSMVDVQRSVAEACDECAGMSASVQTVVCGMNGVGVSVDVDVQGLYPVTWKNDLGHGY
jgi:hypothetical protein